MIDHDLLLDFDFGILFILGQKVLEADVELVKCAEELVDKVEKFSKRHCDRERGGNGKIEKICF